MPPRMGLAKFRIFNPQGQRLFEDYCHEVTEADSDKGLPG